MKGIVNRLQENKQIELARRVLESHGYTVNKIDESKPSMTKESQNTIYVQSEIYVGDTFDVRDSHGEEYETTIKNIYIEDLQSDDPEVFIKHEWTSKKDGRTGTSTHTLGVFKRDFLGIY